MNLIRSFRQSFKLLRWFILGISLVLGLAQGTTALTYAVVPITAQLEITRSPTVLTQLMQQGKDHYQAGQFTQTIAVWQQAETGYRQQGDDRNRSLVLSNLSAAHQQLGQWTEAEQDITKSLQILQSHPDRLILAQALNTQASLVFAQGQTEQAIDLWKQAASLYTVDEADKRLGALLNQAQAQQSLGLYLQAKQTLTEIERSLQTQPDSVLKVVTLRSLGDVLRSTGSLDDARRVLDQSFAIAKQFSPAEQSATLMSLGNVAQDQLDSAAALTYYQQAAIDAPPLTQLQANLNQFRLLVQTQKASAALQLLPTIETQLNLPVSRPTLYARINLSRSLMQWARQDDFALDSQAIAAVLTPAIQQAQSLGDRRAEAYALGSLGSLYEQTQQWTAAKSLTKQALFMAQAVNAADIAYQWQWQLGRVLKAENNRDEAIAAYQAAFETLQVLRSDLLAVSSTLQFSFRESVEPVYREYVELLLRRSVASQPQPEATQANLRQARQVIESLQLAELNNYFRTACLEGQIVTLDQIEQTSAAVIYPIILDDRLEIILSLPQQPLQQYTVNVKRSQVETTLSQLRQNLEKPFTTMQGKQLGQAVYDWLIRPLEPALRTQSLTTLTFVLDGSLRNVPMAALYDGSQYLIEQYSVALTPGLQLFNPQRLKRDRLQVLLAGLTQGREGFSDLAYVKQELQDIEAEVPSRVLLDEAFTSMALQEQIERSPLSIVHLATHGQFSSDAQKTFILAWDKPVTVDELGALLRTTDETRPQPIELLVLSACETAAGDDRAALGLAGVAVQAGARSTLASLWSLNDQSAARLIRQFYRELLNPDLSKTEALRQAQLTLLHDPDYRHPLYWAPYVLIGNWL